MAEILAVPTLHGEAKRVAPMLEAEGRGCGATVVQRALEPLVLVYGLGPQARSSVFWKVYVEALSDVPADALGRAVSEYTALATSEFFPRPGPLRALALKHAAPIWKARDRARRAANSLPRPVVKPEDVEARKAMVADVLASLGARS